MTSERERQGYILADHKLCRVTGRRRRRYSGSMRRPSASRTSSSLSRIQFGPTVLVVDLGRLSGVPFGPSGLLPVFFHDEPPAESCVSGELWQIALGKPGEQVFHLPEFDGKSNLSGHQSELGVLHAFPSLVAITFQCPRWLQPAELLTIWNMGWDQSTLVNQSALQEDEIGDLLHSYSDGLNDQRNEIGWDYRVTPRRPRPTP